MGVAPNQEIPAHYGVRTKKLIEDRIALTENGGALALLECSEYKRKWEPLAFEADLAQAAVSWLASRLEDAAKARRKPHTLSSLTGAVQDESAFLAVASVYQGRRDIDLDGLVADIVNDETVANHPFHIHTQSGLAKREVWETLWTLQRREDLGERVEVIPTPPEYSQGSRGKSIDYLKDEYWKLRGKLNVPKERFVAFTEVPGREGASTLYCWAGWTPLQRLRAILSIDEELEDGGVPLTDRIALLDSAWRLLPDVARQDAAAASRIKAELQAVVGAEGPSKEMLDDWRGRFPPPGGRGSRKNGIKEKKSTGERTRDGTRREALPASSNRARP